MGKRGPKPREQLPRRWTPNLAYCVGLFATDGCLYNDGRHLSFTSSDIELVQTFKSLLELPNRIAFKLSGSSGRRCPHIQFGNVGFYNWLLKIGLTPRKSLILGPLDIPQEFFIDFIRGCFDGDGTIYSYMDKRWANSHMFYVAFASGSMNFIEWIRNNLTEMLNIRGHVSVGKKHSFQLKYAKAESLVLISKMYYNKQIPCLDRKRQKILGILQKHYQIQAENPRIFLAKSMGLDI